MATALLPGNPPIEVNLRRSSRARRLTLRVSSLDGRVTLTLPAHISERNALKFAQERRAWIERARTGAKPPILIKEDATLPVEGRARTVRLTDRAGPRLTETELSLPGDAPGRTAAAFLRVLARDRLAAACDPFAARLNRCYTKLALRDVRSRWGSCSADGRLMFSWRLAMAPPEVLGYVAAHEIAHLVRMDHSYGFWEIVESLCPDWRIHRAWLRQNGPDLHRYSFAD